MPINRYKITEASLLPKPLDVPDDHIAYNPSAIWTVENSRHQIHDIFYVRVEPDRVDEETSHLGKSVSRPYVIDPANPETPLLPYDFAEEKMGEDPALTRISRRMADGALINMWLLSCVNVQTYSFKPNEIRSIKTRFYLGEDLTKLEHIADGPEDMKDIRIFQNPHDPDELHIYGRPRAYEFSGNITHTTIGKIDDLNADIIQAAPLIDDQLFPEFGNQWGGVNDIISVGKEAHILVGHRAWFKDDEHKTPHYESVFFRHNLRARSIVNLGTLATADSFPAGHVKNNVNLDLSDVVFSGGGYNGKLDYVSFGVRDSTIGLGKVRKI